MCNVSRRFCGTGIAVDEAEIGGGGCFRVLRVVVGVLLSV
jgi:hypothetical protein